MHAHNRSVLAVIGLALAILALTPDRAWAYVGPGPGMEMIPYFMSLLMWAGAALGGVLLWPVAALLRRWREFRKSAKSLGVNFVNSGKRGGDACAGAPSKCGK